MSSWVVPALEPCQPDMGKFEDQPPPLSGRPEGCLPPSLADSAGVGPNLCSFGE